MSNLDVIDQHLEERAISAGVSAAPRSGNYARSAPATLEGVRRWVRLVWGTLSGYYTMPPLGTKASNPCVIRATWDGSKVRAECVGGSLNADCSWHPLRISRENVPPLTVEHPLLTALFGPGVQLGSKTIRAAGAVDVHLSADGDKLFAQFNPPLTVVATAWIISKTVTVPRVRLTEHSLFIDVEGWGDQELEIAS